MPSPVTKFFSARRSWVIARTFGSGRTGRRGKKRRGLRRNVLELIGDDIDVVGETVERLFVRVIGE